MARLAHLSAGLLRPAFSSLRAHYARGYRERSLDFLESWPRTYAWSTLLRARAIENLCYCVGLNRVGVDGNELHYAGDSAVLDFLGQPLAELGAQEQVITVTLGAAALAAHRERFPAWMDADSYELKG